MDAPKPEINWHEVARSAIGSAFLAGLIGGALHVLGKAIEAEAIRVSAEAHPVEAVASKEDEASRAASLLGVTLDASPDEIRAALRSKFAESRLHPDHGGDGEQAKELIAAKNLLVERAVGVRP